MAISYPLSMPAEPCPQSVEFRAINAVAVSRSPFTFAQQVHAYPGQAWQADITLPPMQRAKAEAWIAFLIALRGSFGTFLLGDPRGEVPRGLAATFPGAPTVSSASGGSVSITGASANKANWLRAGDYIQLGSGASATLHKVLENVSTSSSGGATLEIWPHVRGTASGAVTVSGAKGVFRLASNETSWSSNQLAHYGITFGAVEAI